MGHLVKCVAGKSTHIRALLSNRWSRTSSTVVVPVDAITTFVSKTDMQERSRLQEKRYSAFKGEIQKLQEIRFSDLKKENQNLRREVELQITNCEENDKVSSRDLTEALRTERAHLVKEIQLLSTKFETLEANLPPKIKAYSSLVEENRGRTIKACKFTVCLAIAGFIPFVIVPELLPYMGL
ncbi:putative Coiled-coil domain-containing protein [Helianthus debilis subsp. tardiflorus]